MNYSLPAKNYIENDINSKTYTSGCAEALENALKNGNFSKKISGQYIYYINHEFQ